MQSELRSEDTFAACTTRRLAAKADPATRALTFR